MQSLTQDEINNRVMALMDKIRPLLDIEAEPVVMTALAILSGEALGSISISPQFTRGTAVQMFCQQASDVAAATEDEARKRPSPPR